MFNRILTVLLLLFLLIFVFSSTMAVKEWLQGKREQETFSLQPTIIDEENKTTDVLPGQDEEYTAYTDLYEKNNDFAAGLQYRIRI